MICIIIRYLPLLTIIIYSSISFASAHTNSHCQSSTVYNIGAGIYDITGPAAEQGMMGYGMVWQKTNGIYQRLWARAFVIESPCNNHRIILVNADLGQLFQGIKQNVIKKLQARYGNLYNDENVLLSATHTHSGPGGYSTYFFYNITTLGFNQHNFDTIVDGIVNAIDRAHSNMTPAHIKLAYGQLAAINYNRSPQAYLLNPINERNSYSGDTDTKMTLLRFETVSGKPIGLYNWFPIHGTVLNHDNTFISGDNKGYAAYLFEKAMGSDYGPHAFVAAFAQENAGDVSPNPYGHEGGVGTEGRKSIEHIGSYQYEMANKLYHKAEQVVSGDIDFRHRYIDMSQYHIDPNYTNGNRQVTCPAALGVSMLAGTQDGEGIGWQGVNCDALNNSLPYFICRIISTKCQGVKPIVIRTGEMNPRPWTPQILPLQVIKIGNVIIGAVPMEVTTMAGRRLKQAIKVALPTSSHVVISSLANAYAGYVTTYEEYQPQYYEGASTHFGPWTGSALQQILGELTKAVVEGEQVESGPMPPDYTANLGTLQADVIFDDKPLNKNFGDVYQEVRMSYQPGDSVKVIFWGGHPKNNYHTQDTFLEVQQLVNNDWQTIKTDNDWDTEYHWQRQGIANSLITITWHLSLNTPAGQYRILHKGDWKSGWTRKIYPYIGYSNTFTVLPLDRKRI